MLEGEDLDPFNGNLDEIPWNTDTTEVTTPEFHEQVGPTHKLPRDATLLDYLKLLFTVELLRMIVDNTNIFAVENLLGTVTPVEMWNQTNYEEICAFLGVIILMGIVKLPRIALYFVGDARLHQTGVASVFTKNRFFKLLKNFHAADPREMPDKDSPEYKLFRIQPVINTLSETFMENYDPHREQSIDKAMVKFKGRLKFLQYMPMKLCKRGIKIWSRCDANNGYVSI